ncbi:carbohydrate ABC transporter permease [Rugosimonospora acidiphila]|uniref:Carbohydrate ABC transporter permease n=1 Tax=Rugosimonospora acidiphila TaxID=556531 RepID=A0ABP9SAG8_9ACTN
MTDTDLTSTVTRPAAPPPPAVAVRPRRRRGVVVDCLLVLVALAFITPFLFTLVASFRTSGDIARNPLGLPHHLTIANYRTSIDQIRYGSSVLNTLLLTLASCVAVSIIGAAASYPLGRLTSHLSSMVYRLFVIGLTIPIFVIIAPLYLLMRDLHLLDSRIGLVIIYTALNLPVSVFFYTSFVRQIPVQLEEAAALDGCGPLRTFFSIVFPLLRPITGTLLTFVSLQVWNNLVVPLVFLQDASKSTVMANAYSFADPHTLQPTQLFPAALLGALPLFLLFLVFQRQVVEGMTQGAVK